MNFKKFNQIYELKKKKKKQLKSIHRAQLCKGQITLYNA